MPTKYNKPIRGRRKRRPVEIMRPIPEVDEESDCTFPTDEGIFYPPTKKPLSRVIRDRFVKKKGVPGLSLDSFNPFLKTKDIALVMFYDPCSPLSGWSKDHFAQAAGSTNRDNHVYAGVDCTSERELCSREHANKLPFFRLYSKGKALGAVREPKEFKKEQMVDSVEQTPVESSNMTTICSRVFSRLQL